MGIAFADMSPETLAHLRELLATLSRSATIVGPGAASTLPAASSLSAVPAVSNPAAAVKAITEFFETRQMLMRDDFLRILRKSQGTETK